MRNLDEILEGLEQLRPRLRDGGEEARDAYFATLSQLGRVLEAHPELKSATGVQDFVRATTNYFPVLELLSYKGDLWLIFIGALDESDWVHAVRRRSGIQFALDLFPYLIDLPGIREQLDLPELDELMRASGQRLGPITEPSIPPFTPPSHWWWWFPDEPPSSWPGHPSTE
jgi:hypothetical protein